MKQRIYEIIEGVKPKDKAAARYELFINFLVLVTVITLFLDTFQGFAEQYKLLLTCINVVVIAVFTVDYFFRVWTADLKYPTLTARQAKKKYIFSPLGIIDALATFPPFISIIFHVNLDIFRLFRLLRLFKMDKLASAVSLFGNVFKRKSSELIMVFSLVFMLIYVCAILMFYVENPAQPDVFTDGGTSMWWAVITLTTIGYGDMYPITPLGHALGGFIALLGIGVIALPTGILSSGLMEELNARKEAKADNDKLARAKGKSNKHVCPHCGEALA